MNTKELDITRSAVMRRVGSLEAQGCLPVDGGTLAAHTALFNEVSPDAAARAVWSLINDSTLCFDPATDLVDLPK